MDRRQRFYDFRNGASCAQCGQRRPRSILQTGWSLGPGAGVKLGSGRMLSGDSAFDRAGKLRRVVLPHHAATRRREVVALGVIVL